MKRTALFSLFILSLTIILPACKEDVYMDWNIQNEKALADTIKKYKDSTNFYTTASGLSYKVIWPGTISRKPSSSSYIYATYTGKLIDGTTFDSGTNAYLGQVAALVPGFQEAVKKMKTDANYIFYIPSTLGYDTVSTNALIPSHSALIFDVTLTSVY